MDDFKKQISEDVLNTLIMEDLWKSPGLKKYIQEKYPRTYIKITELMREFGLYGFIKIAEAQKKMMQEALIQMKFDIVSKKKFKTTSKPLKIVGINIKGYAIKRN